MSGFSHSLPVDSDDAPTPPSPSLTPLIPESQEASSSAFYHLLLSSSDIASPNITLLADTLLRHRIDLSFRKEMKALSGELRDEWKVRVGGVKADWMARVVPDPDFDLNDGAEEGDDITASDPTVAPPSPPTNTSNAAPPPPPPADRPLLPATIISDTEARESMEHRVDSAVEKEFNDRIEEAQARIRKAVTEKETVEVEVFLGGLLLDARAEFDDDEEVSEAVTDGLLEALELLGYRGSASTPVSVSLVAPLAESTSSAGRGDDDSGEAGVNALKI